MSTFTITVIIKSNIDVCIEYRLFCTKYFAYSIPYSHFNMLKQFRELVWGQWEGLSVLLRPQCFSLGCDMTNQ